jgi:hypothetical protein
MLAFILWGPRSDANIYAEYGCGVFTHRAYLISPHSDHGKENTLCAIAHWLTIVGAGTISVGMFGWPACAQAPVSADGKTIGSGRGVSGDALTKWEALENYRSF